MSSAGLTHVPLVEGKPCLGADRWQNQGCVHEYTYVAAVHYDTVLATLCGVTNFFSFSFNCVNTATDTGRPLEHGPEIKYFNRDASCFQFLNKTEN